MSHLNAEQMLIWIDEAIKIIDNDPSPAGTTSDTIDRAMRSTFELMRSVVKNSILEDPKTELDIREKWFRERVKNRWNKKKAQNDKS